MEEFEIINYFDDDYQEYWRNEIQRTDWEMGIKLFDILSAESFKEIYGENSKLYLVTDGESLICYCAFMEKNPSISDEYNPWIGYLYTFDEYRGNGYMRELVEFVTGEIEGAEKVYVATELDDFYEKLSFDFVKEIESSEGKKKIYSKNL